MEKAYTRFPRKSVEQFKQIADNLTPSIASDWGCVLVCGSYAPGLGQSGVGRPSSDVDYVELMGQNELTSIDENLNLDHLNNFSFSEFMQSYNKPQ